MATPRTESLAVLSHVGAERYDAKIEKNEMIIINAPLLEQATKHASGGQRSPSPLLRVDQYHAHPFANMRATADAKQQSLRGSKIGCVVFGNAILPGYGWLQADNPTIDSQELETMLCTDASVYLQPKHARARFPLSLKEVLILPNVRLLRTDSRMGMESQSQQQAMKLIVVPSLRSNSRPQLLGSQWELVGQTLMALNLKTVYLLFPQCRSDTLAVTFFLAAMYRVLESPWHRYGSLRDLRILVADSISPYVFSLLSDGVDQLNRNFALTMPSLASVSSVVVSQPALQQPPSQPSEASSESERKQTHHSRRKKHTKAKKHCLRHCRKNR